jgi:beta-lactamase class A
MKYLKSFSLIILITFFLSVGLFKIINLDFRIYAQTDNYAPLQAAVDKLPTGSGVLIILPGGKTISKNEGQQFPSFSVIKLWIAAAFLDAADNGEVELNDPNLTLIKNMLQNSDNNAANELIDLLGGCSNTRCDGVNQFIASGGFNRTILRRKMLETPNPQNDNLTSPQDAVTFMQQLLDKQISSSANSETIYSILQARTASGTDPFKPNNSLPSTADFVGKSGILGSGRNDVGTFADSNGQRIFFAIFAPNGGVGTDQLISNIEQLAYNPSSQPTTLPPGSSSSGSIPGAQSTITTRACVKIGNPTESKPSICSETSTSFRQGQQGNFTFYCQGNPQWDRKGDSCSMGQIGCGPTSLAMIFSYFGDIVDPARMYQTYVDNKMINCDVGSYPGLVNAWVAKQPGYEVGPDIGSGTLNAVEAKKFIDAGWLILASSDNFIGQKGKPIGHIFVVQDVDPAAGTFILRDPENCSYSSGEEFTDKMVQPITGGKVPSWKYAYPIRKQAALPVSTGVNQDAF